MKKNSSHPIPYENNKMPVNYQQSQPSLNPFLIYQDPIYYKRKKGKLINSKKKILSLSSLYLNITALEINTRISK